MPSNIMSLIRNYSLAILLPSALFATSSAQAISPIPEQQGWSGQLVLGAGHTNIKSNTVAGNDFIEGADEEITSINNSPNSNDDTHPLLDFEIKYTLSGRNQIFIGNSLEDRLTMDTTNQLGWRKQTETAGTFQLGAIFSSTPFEVWEDPYQTNARRKSTDADTTGLRFEWDRILGSGFGAMLQTREIDIDKELSGTHPSLNCDSSCQKLLDRNGDQYRAQLYYTIIMGNHNHILQPKIQLRKENRDGDATSQDAWATQLSYTYLHQNWVIITNALYGESSFDKRNPLYDQYQDADKLSMEVTVIRNLKTESGNWQLMGGLFWGESDSKINFHNNETTQLTLGAIYNFGN